jgi:hypothetical protein
VMTGIDDDDARTEARSRHHRGRASDRSEGTKERSRRKLREKRERRRRRRRRRRRGRRESTEQTETLKTRVHTGRSFVRTKGFDQSPPSQKPKVFLFFFFLLC